MNSPKRLLALLVGVLSLQLTACAEPDPEPTDAGLVDAGQVDAGPGPADGGSGTCATPPRLTKSECVAPSADTYQPRNAGSANDTWPACISDSNTFTPLDPNIGSIARTTAFEEIAAKLWVGDKRPTAQEFIDARVAYAVDQGIDSRVQRREDWHYAAAPNGGKCSDVGVPAANPARCVGPNTLLPLLTDAFAKGARGETPRIQAARIQAGLEWFFHISSLAEVMSATTSPKDVDSSWAYYAGGTARNAPIGLGKLFAELTTTGHDAAYDATLATRCWRDIDPANPATRTDLRDRAFVQLDRALLHGQSVLARAKLLELACTSGEVKAARWAYLQTMLPFFDRALRASSPSDADRVKALAAIDDVAAVSATEVTAAEAILLARFGCP